MNRKIISIVTVFILFVSLFSFGANADESILGVGQVKTSSSDLMVRKTKSTKSDAVSKLKNGSLVTLISKSGDWWRVKYSQNAYGYCSASYITVKTYKSGYVSTDGANLNIRSGAGTENKVLGKLKNGEKFAVVSESSGWLKILYNGTKSGYVFKDYTKYKYYSAVSLELPDYKQTDSRWADIKLGSSSSTTIKKIGCVICSLANSETYRKGVAVTPKDLSKSLKFTSGGAVYWPDNYTQYAKNEYLSVVYNKLKSGIPVIIGAKSSKSTHYVTVYGFKKSNNLSAENFLVKDPAGTNAKTLKDFFASYPTFLKLVYYK